MAQIESHRLIDAHSHWSCGTTRALVKTSYHNQAHSQQPIPSTSIHFHPFWRFLINFQQSDGVIRKLSPFFPTKHTPANINDLEVHFKVIAYGLRKNVLEKCRIIKKSIVVDSGDLQASQASHSWDEEEWNHIYFNLQDIPSDAKTTGYTFERASALREKVREVLKRSPVFTISDCSSSGWHILKYLVLDRWEKFVKIQKDLKNFQKASKQFQKALAKFRESFAKKNSKNIGKKFQKSPTKKGRNTFCLLHLFYVYNPITIHQFRKNGRY